MPTVCVLGLWHLGSATAACLAGAGYTVVGLDGDADTVEGLQAGRAPISEPGLNELLAEGIAAGRLRFTIDPVDALAQADVVWVAFDTPVDDNDNADEGWVRARLDEVRPAIQPGTLVFMSSQVPVGFTQALEAAWRPSDPTLQFASSPENLRLGQAIQTFRQPGTVCVGLGAGADRDRVTALLAPFTQDFVWMSLASAEMTKHARNGFLALSVVYANELARICEEVGADATEVERGLRAEPRIGARAYVSPGPPIAGGTLIRDIAYLARLSAAHDVSVPVVSGVARSNTEHKGWLRERITRLLAGVERPRLALLGLTYKAGTDTLRRSSALELAHWCADQQIQVQAFDPAVRVVPDATSGVSVMTSLDEALAGADVAVLATAWPEFRMISPEQITAQMRRPCIIDEAGFLPHLAGDERLTYVRVGKPSGRVGSA